VYDFGSVLVESVVGARELVPAQVLVLVA